MKLSNLTESEILNTPIKDFKLEFSAEQIIAFEKLNKRLQEIGVNWKPQIWLDDEWYSPDGYGGFAIPFSLTNKRLIKIEKEYLGFCEGESKSEFYKLCLHEVGHALDNVYHLRKLKRRQALFGKTSKPYPRSYTPDPYSKDHIQFLGDYYAQAHPDEDWAETVAYFLYKNNWESKYKNTKAWEKLSFVQDLFNQLPSRQRKVGKKKILISSKNDHRTFEQYLKEKKKSLRIKKTSHFSCSNLTFLNQSQSSKDKMPLLKSHQEHLVSKVAKKASVHPYYALKCFLDLKKECQQRQLTLKLEQQEILEQIILENLSHFMSKEQTKVFM